jgi:two-component system phosphate regulon sensor histidine kinase PhoR
MPSKDNQIQKLIELNDELENYFRNTIIPQLFVDADLILRKFTPPAMKQFKLSKGDVGRSIMDIKENFRFPSIIENIQQVIDTEEILEKEIQTTDMRWYQMNIIPYIVKKDNRTNGVIITFVEITRRIQDLKDQERLISDHETLLDTISHDFKTPLTSLILTTGRLKKAVPEESKDLESLVTIVDNGIRKMQAIVAELMDSRQEDYKYKAAEELLNFEHVLEDVCLTLAENILESHAVLKNEIDVSEFTFSRRKLRSIVYNLVLNAIKFKAPDRIPQIFIKTALEGSYITILIKDNGIGIEHGKIESIFNKYTRIEKSVSGSGIGLYLVREMVNNSGGKITVNSQPGIGSEFKVYLKADNHPD